MSYEAANISRNNRAVAISLYALYTQSSIILNAIIITDRSACDILNGNSAYNIN